MADDLYPRIRAAIEGRLALARAATPGPWHIGNAVDPTKPCNVHAFPSARGVADEVGWLDAEFIAANHPAWAIRALEADLSRLDQHQPIDPGGHVCIEEDDSWPCREIERMARVYLEETE